MSATEIWTLKAAITHRGGIASHVSLAYYLLMEELVGLDESIHVNVFRIATRTKTSLVYIGNERISMTLHEQSNKALEALEVWQPSPFKNVE